MAVNETAEALGLVVNDGPRELPLAHGVVLVMRPPEARDWVMARDEVAKIHAADRVLTAAGKRYAWSVTDKLALVEPALWERVAHWCLMVELAVLIVSEVYRTVGDERRSAPADIEAFRFLFRQGDNFDLFDAEARKADLELIQPKKE